MFNTSRNKCSSLLLKPCKSDQETSEGSAVHESSTVVSIERPLSRFNVEVNKSSTEAVFIENYEIKFFRSNYTHILEYLCRVSFLTTLDIYRDYFKSRHKVMQGVAKE